MKRKFSFPRKEPRFAPWLFSLSWEQRKLIDETTEMLAGGDVDKNILKEDGKYPVVANALTNDGIVGYYDEEYRVKAPAVTVTGRGDVGHAKARLVDFTPVVRLLSIKSEHDVYFLENAINTLKIVVESTGVPQLTVPQLSQYELKFPQERQEEKQIGAFFQAINDLITLHQRGANSWVRVRFRRFCSTTIFWEQREFGEIVSEYVDPVSTPTKGYYRLGIKSHAKGTFHSYVRPGMELGTAQMHRVAANNFIVNITFGWEHAVAITTEDDAGKLVSHRFPQFSFSAGMVPAYFKYLILDEDFRHHLWLASPGGAGRNRVLKISEMLEYKFWVPSQEEQQKISILLTKLDDLITLHQCKLRMLSKLRKMQILPENALLRRRKTTAWEQRRLESVCSLQGGNAWKSSDYTEDGTYLVVTIANVSGDVTINDSVGKYINAPETSEYTLKENDILISLTGNVGRVSRMSKAQAVLNQRVARVIFKDANVCDSYIFSILHNPIFEQAMIDAGQGAAQKNIKNSDVTSYVYSTPQSYVEQTRIGHFFEKIDHLITLHQRKLELVKNRVKTAFWRTSLNNYDGCPLRLTFAWEQRKVSEIATFSKGTGYSKSDIRDKGTPLILYGRLYTKYETVICDVDTFTTPKDGSVYSLGGEVIIPASGETAEDISIASVVEKSGVILGGDLNIVTPQSGIDSAFLALSISHGEAHRSLSKLAQGKSVVHIHNSDIQTVEVGIPVQAEQESISQFFEGVDRLITLHQREFTHTKPNTNYVKYYQRNRPLLCVLRSMDKSV